MPSPYGPWTLGELVAGLEETYRVPLPEYFDGLPEGERERNVYIDWCDLNPGHFHSYRGYYDHLAFDFDLHTKPVKVKDFLAAARNQIGATHTGYKGGEFTMDEDTPVWVSQYGDNSHWGVIGIENDEYTIRIVTKKFD